MEIENRLEIASKNISKNLKITIDKQRTLVYYMQVSCG